MAFRDFGHLWRIADIGGGRVCFADTGIGVEVVAGRFAAGESIAELAKDYGLPPRVIEAGIRLVVTGAGGRFGIRRDVVRRMEDQIPLLQPRRG